VAWADLARQISEQLERPKQHDGDFAAVNIGAPTDDFERAHSGDVAREASFIHSGEQLTSETPLSASELALAQALNKAILSESSKAELVVTNLPDMPPQESALGYFQLVDEITKELPRSLLVRGTQLEVITAFS